MIHLHTLGDALITVGDKEIRPSSPMIFAALLYLGVERGRRVPRAALQEMFFPKSDERSGSHSVRQLLYKLRQLGVTMRSDDSSCELTDLIADDCADSDIQRASLALLRSGFMPNYAPAISREFTSWLEQKRDQQTTRIVRILLDRLREGAESVDLVISLEICAAILEHDPLNEEATFAKSKALASSGQKQRALSLLADYSREVGSDLRLPADALRRRIDLHSDIATHSPQLIGRDFEIRALLSQYFRSTTGTSVLSLVWGDPGIGKSRLVQELASRLKLEGVSVVWAHCQQHTVETPLGVLSDLVPTLMRCRGALGVAPSSMMQLRRLEGRVDDTAIAVDPPRLIHRAFADLMTSVASEAPLVVIVEDIQWLDEGSLRSFCDLPADSRLHVVFTCRDDGSIAGRLAARCEVYSRRLVPLPETDAATLLSAFLNHAKHVDDKLRRECVQLAAGNPLFLRTLAQHLSMCGDLPSAQARIPDLMLQRLHLLQPRSLLLIRLIAVLDALSTTERLKQCFPIDSIELLLALQELSDRGLVVLQEDAVRCSHQVLVDTVLSHIPAALRTELFLAAARQLESEGKGKRQASLLWSCAEYFQRGGDVKRAVSVLRECAAYAVELGQPRYAIPALERISELCDPEELSGVLENTIRVGDLATDNGAILRNVARFRRLAPHAQSGALQFVNIAEVRALRRLGHDVWDRRHDMLGCIASQGMPMSDRRRAARTYIVAADESLQRDEALAATDLLSSLWSPETGVDALELRMLFHLTLGDVGESALAARSLLSRIEELPMLARCVHLDVIARVLCVAGQLSEAIAVAHGELDIAQRVGDRADVALTCARLADFYLTCGDGSQARHWLNETSSRVESGGFEQSYHLYNAVTVSIAENDLDGAGRALALLKTLKEARKLHAIRSIAGMEMLLANLAGILRNYTCDIPTLRSIDDRGKRHSEHLTFAIGFFLLLTERGFTDEAARRAREYFEKWRRERYDPWPIICASGLTSTQLAQLSEVLHEFRTGDNYNPRLQTYPFPTRSQASSL